MIKNLPIVLTQMEEKNPGYIFLPTVFTIWVTCAAFVFFGWPEASLRYMGKNSECWIQFRKGK